MCGHQWLQINNLVVCAKCGLTKMPDGRIFFDRKLPNYKFKKRKRK